MMCSNLYDGDTLKAGLYLSIMDPMGVPLDRLGDTAQRLRDL